MKQIKNSPLFFFDYAPNVIHADGTNVKHQNLQSQRELKNELIVILTKEDGKKITFNSRTVNYQDKIFIAPLPNPVHILLNSGIENFNNSIKTLELLKNDCQLDKHEQNIHVLTIDSDNTNKNFNDLVKFKMMSVISLVTSLEAFLNQIVPNDFIYIKTKNKTIRRLNKNRIESPDVTFKEKLTNVINQLLGESDFSIKNADIITRITELYNLRREVIHLKTYSENEIGLYFKSIGKLLDIELEQTIISVKEYMNLIKNNFVN